MPLWMLNIYWVKLINANKDAQKQLIHIALVILVPMHAFATACKNDKSSKNQRKCVPRLKFSQKWDLVIFFYFDELINLLLSSFHKFDVLLQHICYRNIIFHVFEEFTMLVFLPIQLFCFRSGAWFTNQEALKGDIEALLQGGHHALAPLPSLSSLHSTWSLSLSIPTQLKGCSSGVCLRWM